MAADSGAQYVMISSGSRSGEFNGIYSYSFYEASWNQ
jgi:hypothetical protein